MDKVYVVVGSYHPSVEAVHAATVRVYADKKRAQEDLDFFKEWAYDLSWNMSEVEVIGELVMREWPI